MYSVQAAVDVAVQADGQCHLHQPPQHGDAQAIQVSSFAVKDALCPDRI